MSKVRILFLGTPEFAVTSLERLVGDEHFQIVGVITQPDRPAGRKMQITPSPVKRRALELGLNVYSPATVNNEEFRQHILALTAESAAVVAFGQILGQKFLDLFPKGCVNVHGSILPRWRGAAPIQRALMAGDSESGVTLQKIVRKLDAGDILGTRRLVISEDMDAMRLHDELKTLGADLLRVEYMDYLRGHLAPVPQDESLVTHANKIDKAEVRLRWSFSAEEIFNQVRGLQMGPYAWTQRQGQALKIHRTRIAHDAQSKFTLDSEFTPGRIVSVETEFFSVACGQGVLDVWEVQPESRARMLSAEYIRGYGIKPGDFLT